MQQGGSLIIAAMVTIAAVFLAAWAAVQALLVALAPLLHALGH